MFALLPLLALYRPGRPKRPLEEFSGLRRCTVAWPQIGSFSMSGPWPSRRPKMVPRRPQMPGRRPVWPKKAPIILRMLPVHPKRSPREHPGVSRYAQITDYLFGVGNFLESTQMKCILFPKRALAQGFVFPGKGTGPGFSFSCLPPGLT